jgi:formylglycine-generating enzyme required for sulfatase activity
MITQPWPTENGSGAIGCTWSSAPGSKEAMPVTCIEPETAAEACVLRGGRLVSEAQFEHAARGRGKGYRFPWGNDFPGCCVAAFGGKSCSITLVPPVGSHPPSDACGGLGDRTEEGVLDLGGSVQELMLDRMRDYDDACWRGRGVLQDPVCDDPTATVSVVRGGDFQSKSLLLLSALRHNTNIGIALVGFRCAYELSPKPEGSSP